MKIRIRLNNEDNHKCKAYAFVSAFISGESEERAYEILAERLGATLHRTAGLRELEPNDPVPIGCDSWGRIGLIAQPYRHGLKITRMIHVG